MFPFVGCVLSSGAINTAGRSLHQRTTQELLEGSIHTRVWSTYSAKFPSGSIRFEYRELITKFKTIGALDMILCTIPLRHTDVTDIKYWSLLNKINFNIHTLATIEKCRFVNLDQRQLQMDRSKKYDPATYYFDKAVKIRFRIQPKFFSKHKKSSRIALDTMEHDARMGRKRRCEVNGFSDANRSQNHEQSLSSMPNGGFWHVAKGWRLWAL